VQVKSLKRAGIRHLLLQTLALVGLSFLVIPGMTQAAGFAPVTLMADPRVSTHRVKAVLPMERLLAAEAQTSTITINYLPAGAGRFGDICTTWPAAAQAAFSYAAGIWQGKLNSSVPITIEACWATNLPPGALGHGGYLNSFRNFTNAPQLNTEYPVALANSLAGRDLDTATPDIYIGFNNAFSWFFGTDENTPPAAFEYDLVSVALHEICHGLGFIGAMEVTGTSGGWGDFPLIYDRFTQNGSGQTLLNTTLFPNPSAALAAQLTGGNLFFNGTNANAANAGSPAGIYAPPTWSDGSSYSHLGEDFNGTDNALMTFSLSNGESLHDPGPVTLGILKDLGWLVSPSLHTLSVTISGNGSVNSTPAGIACTTGNSGICSHQFSAGQSITLTPAASSDSMFEAWSGGCTSESENNCSITLLNDKTISAAFIILPPVFTGGIYYGSLQSAYDAAAPGSTIKARAVALPAGNLTLNPGKTVLLEGGYDSNYESNSGGYTTMQGVLTIQSGSLTVENLIIK
jgi:hypothetical protein